MMPATSRDEQMNLKLSNITNCRAGFSSFTGLVVILLGVHSVREAIAVTAAVLACFFLVTAQRRS